MATQDQFTGADPDEVPSNLLGILEEAMRNHPRSLQERIGPSELGNDCDRCLAHKLAGTTELPEAAWLPQIGTAVHSWAEQVILGHEYERSCAGEPGRYMPECTVHVGSVGGVDITGTSDVFDTHSGTVVDWKIVGKTTLDSVRRGGPSGTYRAQAHLYGKGWEDAGYTVKSVLIMFLPRNAFSVRGGIRWQEPYDRKIAEDCLAHANEVYDCVQRYGLDAVLEVMPPHTNTGFTCRKFDDGPLFGYPEDPAVLVDQLTSSLEAMTRLQRDGITAALDKALDEAGVSESLRPSKARELTLEQMRAELRSGNVIK